MAVSEEIQEKVLEEATSATPNYDIDYSRKEFTDVTDAKNQALTENEQLYGGMIADSDSFYQAQINASQDWAAKQTELQNEQTDFAIEKIEQQKEQANKDYLKEQSGAYVDWQKQSNKYGTEAEKMASAGLTGTGFAESSQVSMYNTYQNRVATAREAYGRAVLNYDNAIKDAMLQNNAALAEIAYQALEKQLTLSLEGFQYKNSLILEQANKKLEIDNVYHNRYLDVLNQINTENAMKEDIRQYQETQKWQTEQAQLDRDFDAAQAELGRAHDLKRDELNREFEAAQAELDRKHDKEMLEAETKAEKEMADYNYKLAMQKLEQEHQNELAILDKQLANSKAEASYKKSLENSSNGGYIITGSNSGGSAVKLGNTIASSAANIAKTAVNTPVFTGSSYNDAVSFMKKNGVPSSRASGIKTANEWARTSSSSWDKKNFKTYKEYLSWTVKALINEYK